MTSNDDSNRAYSARPAGNMAATSLMSMSSMSTPSSSNLRIATSLAPHSRTIHVIYYLIASFADIRARQKMSTSYPPELAASPDICCARRNARAEIGIPKRRNDTRDYSGVQNFRFHSKFRVSQHSELSCSVHSHGLFSMQVTSTQSFGVVHSLALAVKIQHASHSSSKSVVKDSLTTMTCDFH
jgi:hypothetical protein